MSRNRSAHTRGWECHFWKTRPAPSNGCLRGWGASKQARVFLALPGLWQGSGMVARPHDVSGSLEEGIRSRYKALLGAQRLPEHSRLPTSLHLSVLAQPGHLRAALILLAATFIFDKLIWHLFSLLYFSVLWSNSDLRGKEWWGQYRSSPFVGDFSGHTGSCILCFSTPLVEHFAIILGVT